MRAICFNIYYETSLYSMIGLLTLWESDRLYLIANPATTIHQEHVPIGVNRPAFGGTVPHFHQMSRVPRNETDVPHFFKWWLLFCCVADYFTFLPWNATKWRIKLGSYFARRQTPSIFHAWQQSPVTVYCVTPPAASTPLPWHVLGPWVMDSHWIIASVLRITCALFSIIILRIWDGGGVGPPLKKMAPKRKCNFNEDLEELG